MLKKVFLVVFIAILMLLASDARIEEGPRIDLSDLVGTSGDIGVNLRPEAEKRKRTIFDWYKNKAHIPFWCSTPKNPSEMQKQKTGGGLDAKTHFEVRKTQRGAIANSRAEREICEWLKDLRKDHQ